VCIRYAGTDIGNQYGGGFGKVWLDDLNCTGTETSLADCTHNGWGDHDCAHYKDVSVRCGTPHEQYGNLSLCVFYCSKPLCVYMYTKHRRIVNVQA